MFWPSKRKAAIRSSGKREHPFLPAFTLFLLFACVTILSLLQTARNADAVDADQAKLALTTSVQDHVDQIVGLISDAGCCDGIGRAVYRPKIDWNALNQLWGNQDNARNYDSVFMVDPSGKVLLGYDRGRVLPSVALDRSRASLAVVIGGLSRRASSIGGLVKRPSGVSFAGATDVLPDRSSARASGHPPGRYRLVFLKRMSPEFLHGLARTLDLDDLKLNAMADGRLEIPLEDVRGLSVGHISWKPSGIGATALRNAMPLVALELATALLLCALIARQAHRTLNELSRQALTDGLTQLPNRWAFRKKLSAKIERGENVGVGILDLDAFKVVNDSYGHAVGDRLIVDVGAALREIVPSNSCVARLDGDEFAFLTSGPNARDDITALAERILARFANPFRIDARTVIVGASIGLAHALDGTDARELKRRADSAMHAAKQAGKMRYRWFDQELDDRHAADLRMENDLRDALATGGLRLAYQPLVSALDGQLVGVEALLRWTDRTGNELNPAQFIPVAEQSGLIDIMGMFVLRRACEDGRAWPVLKVAVNVSTAQLKNPDFASWVANILRETGFPADRLELELTESYLIVDPDAARAILANLRSLGLSISLDDFGTGYASIGLLRQFQFDKMKVDRSLVVEAQFDETARALLLASITMARALGMTITAEGIETEVQADLMRTAGCDQFQGWLFGAAVPAQQISLMDPTQISRPVTHSG